MRALKLLVLAALVLPLAAAALLVSIMPTQPAGDVMAERTSTADSVKLDRLMIKHQCSHRGLDRTPVHAIIRTRTGDVRLVSFERGWQVHEKRPGDLVAVCRA
jgi:hypothetical protein